MITVKELKNILEELPDSTRIILSRDEEGNSYKSVQHFDLANVIYLGYNDYEIYEQDDCEENVYKFPAVVLYP